MLWCPQNNMEMALRVTVTHLPAVGLDPWGKDCDWYTGNRLGHACSLSSYKLKPHAH